MALHGALPDAAEFSTLPEDRYMNTIELTPNAVALLQAYSGDLEEATHAHTAGDLDWLREIHHRHVWRPYRSDARALPDRVTAAELALADRLNAMLLDATMKHIEAFNAATA
jgi:hypothetical protein